MIELASASTVIATPVNRVFAFVTDMENYRLWFPGVVEIRSKNNLAHGVVGKQYTEILAIENAESELTIEVYESDINQRFVTKGDLAGILPQMTVEFSANADHHCRLGIKYHSLSLTERSEDIIALKRDLAGRLKKGINNLKNILELNA